MTVPMTINCKFSTCRRYRYTWYHVWDYTKRPCAFIGLNPSTADEDGPDPTVRRCVNYAKGWGYGALLMLNLFAFRATDPREMMAEADPVGPENDRTIVEMTKWVIDEEFGLVVAAWGAHGAHRDRAATVKKLLPVEVHYLTLTKGGEPGHPLYLKSLLMPTPWETQT